MYSNAKIRFASSIVNKFVINAFQLKAVVINGKLRVVASECVQFDTELPEYRTDGGVHGKESRDGRITSPTLMWVKALDILLDKIRIAGIDFSQVVAISGAGQVTLFVKYLV